MPHNFKKCGLTVINIVFIYFWYCERRTQTARQSRKSSPNSCRHCSSRVQLWPNGLLNLVSMAFLGLLFKQYIPLEQKLIWNTSKKKKQSSNAFGALRGTTFLPHSYHTSRKAIVWSSSPPTMAFTMVKYWELPNSPQNSNRFIHILYHTDL